MLTLMAFYVCAGLLLSALSVPLMKGLVKPNYWYGFRVRQTLADPIVWYAANAYSGRRLFWVGIVTSSTAQVLFFVPGIEVDSYATACAVVALSSLAVTVFLSFRYLNSIAPGR
jgi:hypothetical protein